VRIEKITYRNYRCFINSEISFSGSDGITLVVGDNGSGKSEILLSVLWCFYDETLFKFKDLRGKKNNPYSLHDQIHNKLKSEKLYKAAASVEIKFEDNNRHFTLERKEVFSARNLKSTQYELRFSEKINGVTTTPIRHETQVKLLIQDHLPIHLAKALFFDGEQMTKLTTDDQKKGEVLTVIKEVTDLSNLETLKERLINLKKDPTKRMRKSAQSENVEMYIKDLERQESREITVRHDLGRAKDYYEDALKQIDKILSRIDRIKENSEKKSTLNGYQNNKKIHMNNKENIYRQLSDEISTNGYLFFLKELFVDINKYIKNVKIPIGISSNTLEMIINGSFEGKCVCGRELNNEVLTFMKELKKQLPPEFKPAEIVSQIYYIENDKKTTLHKIEKYNRSLINIDKEVKKINDQIKLLEIEVFDITKDDRNVQDEFKRFINQRDINKKAMNKLGPELESLKQSISNLKKQIKSLKNMTNDFNQAKKEVDMYNDYVLFIETLLSIEKRSSLIDLNAFFKEAFKNISDDLEENFEVEIDNNYQINKYVLEDEKKIYKNSSTGQTKVIAMAFIKAITDFATKVAMDDIFKEKRTFPVFIDAAFGDISGGNLEGVSSQLKYFDTQLVVLVAKDQLNTFIKHIDTAINKKYVIKRIKKEGISKIEEVIA
jgi:DNA sulfur modification protein DndD